jgi:hypothetical protein
MFEDITEKTEQEQIEELEKCKQGAIDLLQQGRDEIKRLEQENKIITRKFNNSYQDARRMAKILSKEIPKDRLEQIFKEQEAI